MSLRITFTTAGRVLLQLRHDPRTIGLMLLVPTVLVVLMKYIFASQPAVFNSVGLVMLGVFPLTSMFLVTSVAMLRERTSGTLERLLTTPLAKLDLLLGYGVAFAIAAALQSALAVAVAFGLLDLQAGGSPGLICVVAICDAILGMALGLLLSAFAASEFQAVQFMPIAVFPQVLLCGLIAPRAAMSDWLRWASDVMPMTYAVEALTQVSKHGGATLLMWRNLGIVLAAGLVALALGAATLRRRSD